MSILCDKAKNLKKKTATKSSKLSLNQFYEGTYKKYPQRLRTKAQNSRITLIEPLHEVQRDTF